MHLPKIYPITDRHVSGLSHLEQVKRLAQGGVKFVQLRDKTASSGEFYEAAKAVIEFAHPLGIKIIINDRVDLAYMLKADGVHLGQDDLSPAEARKLLGEESIIGFSTHNIEQVKFAIDLPINYIAIGPVFATSTKEKPDPVVGLTGVSAVKEAIGNMALAAIGGITKGNAPSVFECGADSIAVISGVLTPSPDIARNYKALTESC